MLTKLFAQLSGPWQDGCFLLTREGTIVAANPAGATMLGLPPQEIAGRKFADCFREPPQVIADYLTTCIRNSQQMPGSLSRLDANGKSCQFTCFGYRIQPQPEEPPLIFIRCSQSKTASNKFIALNQQLERQQSTHHQLLTSHTTLKTILDSLDALVYVADMESYEILFVNQYGRDMQGKDITGAICWQTLQIGQTGPCPFCTNCYLTTPEGKPAGVVTWEFQNTVTGRWFYIHDRAISWTNSRLVRLEIATDITARKAAEEKARHDKERADAVLTLARQPWSSREALADQALAEAVRLTSSDIGYLHFLDKDQQTIEFFAWSEKVRNECSAAKAIHYPLKDAGIWADSIRLRQPLIHNDYPSAPNRQGYPEGHFPVLRHLSVPLFEGERIIAVIGVGNKQEPYDQADATQLTLYMNEVWTILKQKLMELEIRTIKEQWEQTFDAIDDIITIHDQDMRIIRANKAAGELFQMAPTELIGKYCYKVFCGGTEPCPGCPEFIAHQTLTTQRANIYHEKLGKTFAAAVFPFTDNTGVTCFVHIAKDISGMLTMEERLRQSQKMEAIGTLAGGIAHDFNNILSAILGYSELIKRDLPPGTAAQKDIDKVIHSGKRAAALVQQILDFSRKTEQNLQPLRPHLIVQEVLQMLRSTLPTTVEILADIDPACGTIMADPTKLHQVILNLCTNGFHAMKNEKGTLRISLSRQDETVKDLKKDGSPAPFIILSVSDTGQGMDQETVTHIFEPYFTTRKQGKEKGTGLGLAIVHRIIEGYKGFIEVESKPGHGSTFRVFIPALEKNGSSPEETKKQESLPLGTERLLIVDDEPLLVQINQRLLEDYGYTVTGTTDSREALEKVRAEPKQFDLILTDQSMPGLSGSELAKAVMEIAPLMPIIICTGHSSVISAEDAYAMGIKRYVHKPVQGDELVRAVRMVLDEQKNNLEV